MAKRLQCDAHSGYRCARPPTTDCPSCWAAYGRHRAIADGLRGRGQAKGGGRSSKDKGRAAVQLVASLIRSSLELEEGDVLVKATSQGGCDIHLSPAALRRFPYSIEVKNDERLNIWAALAQAQQNQRPGLPPIVFFKRANTPVYVCLTALDFMLVRQALCREPMLSST